MLEGNLLSGRGGDGLLLDDDIFRNNGLLLALDDDLGLSLFNDLLNVLNLLIGLVGLDLISPLF